MRDIHESLDPLGAHDKSGDLGSPPLYLLAARLPLGTPRRNTVLLSLLARTPHESDPAAE